jgi:arylsulfatase
MNKPNILWYCTDQQRSDTIGHLGNPHVRTPNIDKLAERGVSFTRAYTQSPICTPSRATFLTGRYPATHHVHRNGCDYFPSDEVLVTKLLADEGYDCGLVGKLHLSRAKGRVEARPDDGYRYFQWSHHPRPDWAEGHGYADWLVDEKGVDPEEVFDSQRQLVYGAGVPAEYHQTTWCTEKSIEFISQNREGPWLLSVNPFDPHPPFDPPADYLDRYNPEDLPYPIFGEADIAHQRKFAAIDQQTTSASNPYTNAPSGDAVSGSGDTASEPPSAYDARKVKACYYAMIEMIDHEFGRILDVLEETDQLDNTLIIFTSDHGELLGDHGLLYKGCRFYEGLVHVPLVMSWPAMWQKNTTADALVELVDLAPTLLEAAGLEIASEMQGSSLKGILNGGTNTHKDHVVCEYYDAVDLPAATHATMYFDGRYKSVVYHGHTLGELYDLQEDPDESNDLWDSDKHDELRHRLLLKHFDAIMATSGGGVERTDSY